MKVLVACEFSGIVRDAFCRLGHDAWSCDLLPTEKPGNHIEGNVLDILDGGWDIMIGHPPCTYLAVSGNAWVYHPEDKHLPKEERRPHPLYPDRLEKRKAAVDFFIKLFEAPIEHICLENPISVISSHYRKSDQTIQPYWFGHPHTKRTSLWLKNLPPLQPTNMVNPQSIYGDTFTKKNRSKRRSRTFTGIAEAMAEQWGKVEFGAHAWEGLVAEN